MRRRSGICFLAILGFGGAFWAFNRSAPAYDGSKTEEVTIYRDEFGIPNIFASTEEGAVYGMGYAQAEDRLEEILKQYRRAEAEAKVISQQQDEIESLRKQSEEFQRRLERLERALGTDIKLAEKR